MLISPKDYADFRQIARRLIQCGVSPSEVQFATVDQRQPGLFGGQDAATLPQAPADAKPFTVPQRYLDLAEYVAAHRDGDRWELLYRTLHRIVFDQRALMKIETDDDVHQMQQMHKAVKRDIHKMKAFVRFRSIQQEVIADDGSRRTTEHFVAWHRPDHAIVPLAGPFFARRFAGMIWTILTPDASATWNGETLSYGPGADVSEAPTGDDLEHLWRTYYASIFNPARVKIKAMKAEMPVRHWPTLPESELIPELIQNADTRVNSMVAKTEGFKSTAMDVIPEGASLQELSRIAETCTACPLHEPATQTVFGVGSTAARVMLVGEQPGDKEDLAGEPFVGPSGQLLNEVMQQSGVAREEVYITNVVKHFKFTPRGKRRIHQKPTSREIFACRPWLEAEIDRIKPELVVCLGATAAQALLGRDFRITKSRGQIVQSEWCDRTVATWHPAAVLRNPDENRREAMIAEMVADLSLVNEV